MVLACAAAAILAAGLSCSKPKPAEPRIPREVEIPAYLKDTIGEVARFAGREGVPVQGYGFVTGLDGTGTKVMPPGIRQQILDMMRRRKVDKAEEVLASPDNAVVMVMGVLPPGIAKGEPFDLEVRAVPTTETTSLEGGFLLDCDLAQVVADRGVAARSDVLATGRGSIFVSPFSGDEKSKASADPRIGRVLAGGRALKARQFRLILLAASVRTVDQITRLVNARFPGAAKGTQDPGRVDLAIPREYQGDEVHFLDLVGAICLRESPDARDRRLNLLVETMQAGKDLDRIALCLEAMGPSVVSCLRPLASHPIEAVRFYVGQTMANLQDAQAVSVLEPIALADASEFQEMAVESLGRLRSGISLGVLGRALGARSARVRVAAWQAMARIAPRMFVSRVFRDKFVLSMVATKGEPFVYVSRTLMPEIAIFGGVSVRPPVLAETRRVVATALEGAQQTTLIARWHGTDYRVEAPLDLRGLVEKMALPMGTGETRNVPGLDLSYSDAVGLLYEMSKKKALSAPLVIQPLQYRVGGDRPTARPIGEPEEMLRPPEKAK
ncbi:MAG: flagellar basal body P-ring protein FlgI [Planctomycetota bacterium]|nr:flagellar basal body P-ring protein FlgI [Planctomycetota bacterium]